MAISRFNTKENGVIGKGQPLEAGWDSPAVPFVPAYDLLTDPMPTDEEAAAIALTLRHLTRGYRSEGRWAEARANGRRHER